MSTVIMMEGISGTAGTDWNPVPEDNISNHSGNSSEGQGSSESILLRFPNVRRTGLFTSKTKKAAITFLGSLMVLIICGASFGTIYSMTSDQNGVSSEPEVAYLKAGETVHSSGITKRANIPQHSIILHDETLTQPSPANTTQMRRQKGRNKKQKNQNRPLRLPANAQGKPPLSLLYQLKLVNGKAETFVNFTKCDDDINGKKLFKGWMAVLSLNATKAGLEQSKNQFVGYGKQKRFASAKAAESALMTIFPKQILFEETDLREISDYCDSN